MAEVERPGASLRRHVAGTTVDPEASPAERVRALCDEQGEASVAWGCAEILRSGSWDDRDLLVVLGGRHAVGEYSRDEPAQADQSYWAPTWAARGLLYAWSDTAAPAVVAALTHEAWRVREMAAKVVAAREIGSAGDAVGELADDPVPRVRAAAARALRMVGEFEHASAALALAHDSDVQVRVRGEQAVAGMSARLDRDLYSDEP
jgi:HEAT repeat protein